MKKKHKNRGGFVSPLFLCICLFFCLTFASCSRSAPQISFHYMALTHYEEESGVEDRVTFYGIIEDNDGIDDIDTIQLFNDASGLYWTLTAGTWTSLTDHGKTWIGSHDLTVPEGESLPSGQYRAVVIDKSGERSERTFGFDIPTGGRYKKPSFKVDIEKNTYTIESAYPTLRIMCYNAEGAFTQSVLVTEKSGALDSLGLSSSSRSAALWSNDSEHFESAISKIVPLK